MITIIKHITLLILLCNSYSSAIGMYIKSIPTHARIHKPFSPLRQITINFTKKKPFITLLNNTPTSSLSKTDDIKLIADTLAALNKKTQQIATAIESQSIFLLKTKAEALVNNMHTRISHGKYPYGIDVNEYIRTIKNLKDFDVDYNPLDRKMINTLSILAKLLITGIKEFMKKDTNPTASITTIRYDLDPLIKMGTKVDNDDKKVLHNILIEHFQNGHVITDDELKKIKTVLTLLDDLDESKEKKNTMAEFMAQYIQQAEKTSLSIIDTTKPEQQQLYTKPTVTIVTEHPLFNELYELETLNYIMDQYEQDQEQNRQDDIMPHVQRAVDIAIKKGFNDITTRKTALLQLRQKVKEISEIKSE